MDSCSKNNAIYSCLKYLLHKRSFRFFIEYLTLLCVFEKQRCIQLSFLMNIYFINAQFAFSNQYLTLTLILTLLLLKCWFLFLNIVVCVNATETDKIPCTLIGKAKFLALIKN